MKKEKIPFPSCTKELEHPGPRLAAPQVQSSHCVAPFSVAGVWPAKTLVPNLPLLSWPLAGLSQWEAL